MISFRELIYFPIPFRFAIDTSNMSKVVVFLLISGVLQSVLSINIGKDWRSNNDDGLSSSNYGLRHFKNRERTSNYRKLYDPNSDGPLRHFKARKPLLSFRDRRGDDSLDLIGASDINEEAKRDVDANRRWMFYNNYLNNQKRSNEDETYRQFFKNMLWNNLKTE